MPELSINTELDRIRKNLLDLTQRNNLLNQRKNRTRTIPFVEPNIDELFTRLVVARKPVRLKATSKDLFSGKDIDESHKGKGGDIPKQQPKGHYISFADVEETKLENRLNSIRRAARTGIEETGINYLHLAIGFLNYKTSETSPSLNKAPLLLIPVAIDRKVEGKYGKVEFDLRWTEEEVQHNLCLERYLEREFGLQLPSFAFESGSELPQNYFNEVQIALAVQNDWTISSDALLSFFSFHKLRMFADLCPENWEKNTSLKSQSLGWQLICGTDDGDAPSGIYAEEYEIDANTKAQNIKLLVDADSSQHSALVDILDGKNVVIEGPPGTGKSQTITNAIASAIQQGKTVLFVAEKLAALEVVYSKLQQLGLGDFCLQLHSDKTTSSSVIESIRSRLEATFDNPEEITDVQKRLTIVRSDLQELVNSTGKRIGPKEIPLYEIFWRINELEDKGIRLFSISEWRLDTDSEVYSEQQSLLMALAASAQEFSDPTKSPWWGFRPRAGDRTQISRAASLISALVQSLQHRDSTLDSLNRYFAKLSIDWLHIVNAKLSLPTVSEALISRIEPAFLRSVSLNKSNECSKALTDRIRNFIADYNRLRNLFSFDWIEDDSTLREVSDALSFFCQHNDGRSLTCSDLSNVSVWLRELIHSLNEIMELSKAIKGIAPFRINFLDEFKSATDQIEHFKRLSLTNGAFLTPSLFSQNVNSLIKRGLEVTRSLQNDQAKLNRCFYMNRLPSVAVIESTVNAIRPHCSNMLRLFDGRYNAAMKTLSEFSRSGDAYWPGEWVAALDMLLNHPKELLKFRYKDEFFVTFGDLFKGIDTDWKNIEEIHKWCQKASESALSPAEICQVYKTGHNHLYQFNVEHAKTALSRISDLLARPLLSQAIGLNRHGIWRHSFSELLNLAETTLQNCPRPEVIRQLSAEILQKPLEEFYDATIHAMRLRSELERNTVFTEEDISFGTLANGLNTDLRLVDWHLQVVDVISFLQLSDAAITSMLFIDIRQNVIRLLQGLRELALALESWDRDLIELSQLGDPKPNWMANVRNSEESQRLRDQLARLASSVNHISAISNFVAMMAECKDAGLYRMAEAIVNGEIAASEVPDSFELSVLTFVAEREVGSSSSLRSFSRTRTETLRQEYRALDKKLLELNRALVAHEIDRFRTRARIGIAAGRVSGFTEMGLIKHELAKKKRFRKVRDLLQKAPISLQALKPCFMMSPLSVAQFAPPETIKFDLLIIDEASQIKPEDALGAILRAKQMVVVGDPKQLPPSSFFERNFEEIDDEEALGVDHAESILEVASRVFYPLRRLRWHYRSQHESLIHFSNERFYKGDLIVFPSPTRKLGALGHYFQFVDNAYFSGGCNPVEAEAVAKAVIKHALDCPNESLGVGTFNHKQSQLILEMIDNECRRNRLSREAIEKLSSGAEPLFVKNLENLQGDERDVIFISYTYGPDRASGRVLNRFGPINSDNGSRRLNVLVTRARRRSRVFASFKSSDIIVGPNASEGLVAFKDYLEYSQSGTVPERQITGRSPQSPFEIAVSKVVRSLGCHAEPQVGVAGYYIDIGVQILDGSGDFILGIECDGAKYHSSKSARDRDRLREEVIISRGWALHRIWSTDWFQNRDKEEKRLSDAIKAAILMRSIRPR